MVNSLNINETLWEGLDVIKVDEVKQSLQASNRWVYASVVIKHPKEGDISA